ncbi:MAG: hypothetical protein JWM11_2190 [Planctomycetaceae bacterium]|nr:hypothetical protein [Planctomycetaceae bacterium]
MALLDAIRCLIHNAEFWSDFLGEEIYNNEYSTLTESTISHGFPVKITLPITAEYSIILAKQLRGFFLSLLIMESGRECTIAYNADDGHPFPHGLRWYEVDLFSRCLAARNSDWYHPGIAVIFMSVAAPVTSQEDAEIAFPLLTDAWESLGLFSGRRLERLVHHCDFRLSEMKWVLDDQLGWVLENAYSCRTVESGNHRFPFDEWQKCVAAAESFRLPIKKQQNFLANALGYGNSSPQPAYRLEVQLPVDASPCFVTEFKRVVFEEGIGTTYWSGGICFPPCDASIPVEAYDTRLFGNTKEGLNIIRGVLSRFGPPSGTGIWSWTERRHLSLSNDAE